MSKTNKAKRRLYLLLGVCIAALLGAVVWLLLRSPLFEPWRLYYDEGRVAEMGAQDSYHANASAFNGNVGSGLAVEVGRFSGVRTLCTLSVGPEGKEMALTWSFAISAGRCKLVMVDIENHTIVLTAAEPEGSFSFTLPPGEYSLKLLGARASLSGEVTLSE